MTDPTPTRAEVEALIEQLMLNAPAVPFNARPYDRIMQDAAMMLFALRERAEAAEAELALADKSPEYWHRRAKEAEVALAAARRAEADGWNDAIEAAAETMANGDLMEAPDHEPWFINRWLSVRALRRAAPTEGEV